MKKYFYPILILLAATTFTSCVRDYTCQCQITYSGKPGLPEQHIREYSLSNTLEEARQECENRSNTYVSDGITTQEKCELY